MATSTLSKKISTLAQIAKDLRQGKDFNITRLTTLKSLCADSEAAKQFCLYLAQRTQEQLTDKPHHIESTDGYEYQHLIDEAVLQIKNFLAEPTKEKEAHLWTLRSKAREVNSTYEKQSWATVRVIKSRGVLLIEQALLGVLRPAESSHWGYHIGRNYAERYNPRYGTGLVPESAPMVEDIANFWSQYHFGKSLHEWLNQK